jgi:hypothetical protein
MKGEAGGIRHNGDARQSGLTQLEIVHDGQIYPGGYLSGKMVVSFQESH